MGVHQFYLYQILWYVIAIIVSFASALLFWNKGEAIAGNKTSFLTYRITGAGAIFVVVLMIFYFINPLKSLSDYKKILLIYYNEDIEGPEEGKTGNYTIVPNKISDTSIQLDAGISVEMVAYKNIFSLSPELDGKTFSTTEEIPKGKYRIKFTEPVTGKSKVFSVDVP